MADKGISRIDSGSTHGWFVRGYKNGRVYSRLFSDGKHCGRDAALVLATTYRNTLWQELAKVAKRQVPRLVCQNSRNSSGYLGVCRFYKQSRTGVKYAVYSVTWRPSPGVQKCTTFSSKKWGDAVAFKKAVAFRKAVMEQRYGCEVYNKIETRRRELRQMMATIPGCGDTGVTATEFINVPAAALRTAAEYDAAKSFGMADMCRAGFRPWGKDDLWLIPGHWYNDLPQGYVFTTIFFKDEAFDPQVSSNAVHFGCLSFGIINHRASAELARDKALTRV